MTKLDTAAVQSSGLDPRRTVRREWPAAADPLAARQHPDGHRGEMVDRLKAAEQKRLTQTIDGEAEERADDPADGEGDAEHFD